MENRCDVYEHEEFCQHLYNDFHAPKYFSELQVILAWVCIDSETHL